MEILRNAIAGTLESSDALVTIEPYEQGIKLELTSTVMRQYGRQIRQLIMETLNKLGVKNIKITVNDRGALDCTLKARVEAAVYRAGKHADPIPWGEL